MKDENEEAPAFAAEAEWCEVRAKIRGRSKVLDLGSITIPSLWIENLAFGGRGFSITFAAETGLVLEKGATIRIQIGRLSESEEGAIPPFDPPYAANGQIGE